MRVAFDLTPLRSGQTGVARYTRAVYDALGAVAPDVELDTFAIGRGSDVDRPLARDVGLPLRVVHRLWSTVGWPPAERLVGPVDVVHATDMIPPPTQAPVVLTVHDVLAVRSPERFPARQVRIGHAQLAAARDRAAAVVVTCEAAADEIAEVGGIPRARMVVAPLGHRPVPDEPPAPVVPRPYLLFVGAITPRKGLARLVEALALLPPGTPPLVVAGPDGHAADEVHAAIDRARTVDVRRLGPVSDKDLTALYANASLLCFPSDSEGFGIPVVEAMAFGVPVVATDIPSVREIGGDTVALVPQGDVPALAASIHELLTDEPERARRVALGVERAASYTWERCAAVVADVYRSLAR